MLTTIEIEIEIETMTIMIIILVEDYIQLYLKVIIIISPCFKLFIFPNQY